MEKFFKTWFKVTITLPKDGEEMALEQLLVLGAGGAATEKVDQNTIQVSGFLPQCPKAMELRRLRANLRLAASEGLFEGEFSIKVEPLRERDWVEMWKASLNPVVVGERLLIVASEEEARGKERIAIVIEPGMAFGTGHHVTTQFCLEEAERWVDDGDVVYDIGTGTGILAIAALKLGAKWAVGVDNDFRSLKIAVANAKRNGVADRFAALAGDLVKALKSPCDVLLCNITSRKCVEMCSLAKGLVRKAMVLSGISLEGRPKVRRAAKKEGWKIVRDDAREGWAVFTLLPR